MEKVRWCFAATVALLVTSDFGLFSGSIVLDAVVAAVVLLVAAYVSWETRKASSRRSGAGLREYGGVYGGASDDRLASGGGCGFGGDGGGSLGGDRRRGGC